MKIEQVGGQSQGLKTMGNSNKIEPIRGELSEDMKAYLEYIDWVHNLAFAIMNIPLPLTTLNAFHQEPQIKTYQNHENKKRNLLQALV